MKEKYLHITHIGYPKNSHHVISLKSIDYIQDNIEDKYIKILHENGMICGYYSGFLELYALVCVENCCSLHIYLKDEKHSDTKNLENLESIRVEEAYRRGYAQGFEWGMQCDIESRNEMRQKIREWRYSDEKSFVGAPGSPFEGKVFKDLDKENNTTKE